LWKDHTPLILRNQILRGLLTDEQVLLLAPVCVRLWEDLSGFSVGQFYCFLVSDQARAIRKVGLGPTGDGSYARFGLARWPVSQIAR